MLALTGTVGCLAALAVALTAADVLALGTAPVGTTEWYGEHPLSAMVGDADGATLSPERVDLLDGDPATSTDIEVS